MWPNPQETKDLVTFTEEILNRKFHFLCSDSTSILAGNFVDFMLSKIIFERNSEIVDKKQNLNF